MAKRKKQEKKPAWWPTAEQKARADAQPLTRWGQSEKDRRERPRCSCGCFLPSPASDGSARCSFCAQEFEDVGAQPRETTEDGRWIRTTPKTSADLRVGDEIAWSYCGPGGELVFRIVEEIEPVDEHLVKLRFVGVDEPSLSDWRTTRYDVTRNVSAGDGVPLVPSDWIPAKP